jgi:hypothetical protein
MALTSDNLLSWDVYRKEINSSRILKLLIRNIEDDAWQKLFGFLLSTDAQLSLLKNESPSELPEKIESVLSDTQNHFVLSILLDGVTALGPLSGSDHIGLLINPWEIDDEAKARILFRLMSTIGRALEEKVLLVREHEEDIPVFEYVPGKGIEYLGNTDTVSTNI